MGGDRPAGAEFADRLAAAEPGLQELGDGTGLGAWPRAWRAARELVQAVERFVPVPALASGLGDQGFAAGVQRVYRRVAMYPRVDEALGVERPEGAGELGQAEQQGPFGYEQSRRQLDRGHGPGQFEVR
jgi:hypothetical protein